MTQVHVDVSPLDPDGSVGFGFEQLTGLGLPLMSQLSVPAGGEEFAPVTVAVKVTA